LGNGDGTFQDAVNYAISSGTGATAVVGDLNGDGTIDLAVSDENAFLALPGNGDGAFRSYIFSNAVANPTGIVMADLNGDGATNVVTVTSDSTAGIAW
jgi:hypothetical protein